MSFFSLIYDGIRWFFGKHGIGMYISQELVPVVTPSPQSSPEDITNVGYDPHDVREQNECTGEAKCFWLDFRSLLLGFGKLKPGEGSDEAIKKSLAYDYLDYNFRPMSVSGPSLRSIKFICAKALFIIIRKLG